MERQKRKHKSSRSKRQRSETPKRRRSRSISSSSGSEGGNKPVAKPRRRSNSITLPRKKSRSRIKSDDLEFCLYAKLLEENKRLKDSYRTDALIIYLLGKLDPKQKMIVAKTIINLFPELSKERDNYMRNYSPRFQKMMLM
jgi:hypothetical protein